MDLEFHRIVRAAWAEAKVNASTAGFATEPMLALAYPPRSFIDQELGFGFGEGPSLQVTLLHLEVHNRRARKVLEGQAKRSRSKKRLDHRGRDALIAKVEARLLAS